MLLNILPCLSASVRTLEQVLMERKDSVKLFSWDYAHCQRSWRPKVLNVGVILLDTDGEETHEGSDHFVTGDLNLHVITEPNLPRRLRRIIIHPPGFG